MSRHLSLFATLFVSAGILAGVCMIVPAPGATAVPVAVSLKLPVAQKVASAAPLAKPALAQPAPARPMTTIYAAQPPVPLMAIRHTSYFVEPPQQVETPQQPAAMMADGSVTEPQEKTGFSDSAAKAAIEADGYKNVKALVKASDGAWRGLAMRGATEVAVSVDTSGSVSTQ